MLRPSSRDEIRMILRAGLDAVNPALAVSNAWNSTGMTIQVEDDLLNFTGRLILLSIGKAACSMAAPIVASSPQRIDRCVVVAPKGCEVPSDALRPYLLESTHPLPDHRSEAGGRALLGALDDTTPEDIVIVLLSGGASALANVPPVGISIESVAAATSVLLRSGAPIEDVNVVRSRLCQLKNGGMLRAAAPARVITLAINDVVSDTKWAIGSGPTLPRQSQEPSASDLVDRWGLRDELSTPILRIIDEAPEKTHPHGSSAESSDNFRILLSRHQALKGAARAAESLGYRVAILDDSFQGSAQTAAHEFVSLALNARDGKPRCFLSAGESTVRVATNQLGGRNQEFALTAAQTLAGSSDMTLGAFATDGVDGPTDAAGAIIDGTTWNLACERGLSPEDALKNHASYSVLQNVGALLYTGPTGSNVNDLVVALADSPQG